MKCESCGEPLRNKIFGEHCETCYLDGLVSIRQPMKSPTTAWLAILSKEEMLEPEPRKPRKSA